MKLTERAKGRWEEILSSLGHSDAMLRKHSPCPACGGEDRYRYLFDDSGGFFCGSLRGDGIGLIKHLRDCSDKEAFELVETVIGKEDFQPERKPKTFAHMLQAKALKAPRSAYLEARGLEMPTNLFFARDVKYYEDGKAIGSYDAMLAPFSKNGKFLTYQATYLRNGKKAPVANPKKTLPVDDSMAGGAVELYPMDGSTLGVAEGVETAIACKMMTGIPTWATLSANLMRSFEPPAGVEKVVIFSDNDDNLTGQAAALHLANRLKMKGLQVTVLVPEVVDTDFNDVLNGGEAEQVKADTAKDNIVWISAETFLGVDRWYKLNKLGETHDRNAGKIR